MKRNDLRAAASTAALSVAELARVHHAAVRAGHPLTDMVALATLNPCSATALGSAPIELIDDTRGLLRVADPRSHVAEVALGFDAAATIAIMVGDRSAGCLFPDVDGSPMPMDADADDHAAELVVDADPTLAGLAWTFDSIRESVFDHIVAAGHSHHVATAQAGLNPPRHPGLDRIAMLHAQRMVADWWAFRLGLVAPSAFRVVRNFHDHALRASNVGTVEAGGMLQ